jgi:hypothetical protein
MSRAEAPRGYAMFILRSSPLPIRNGSATVGGTTFVPMPRDELVTLDMTGDDESIVRWRLDEEIPGILLSGTLYMVVVLGHRPRLRRATAAAIALADREFRAIGGRLVVITDQVTARNCNRECPHVLVAASVRQAESALGFASVRPAG